MLSFEDLLVCSRGAVAKPFLVSDSSALGKSNWCSISLLPFGFHSYLCLTQNTGLKVSTTLWKCPNQETMGFLRCLCCRSYFILPCVIFLELSGAGAAW